MHTFDYTHILNNLRFHACNKGFHNLRTQAFIDVSNEDHDVLPRALVEDKIDRIVQYLNVFFSKDVQKILTKLGHDSEAEFVHYTRNWFCDERGMDMKIRLWHLNNAYEYFLQHLSLNDYPPPTTHVGRIPIKTYEALLHSISMKFSLFQLSSNACYNSRAISTLAVESFFSDLLQFEFGGLGAPKAVDIPKLISHVIHINTTKHDPEHGFEFVTMTRDNYPVCLMEENNDDIPGTILKNHSFDSHRNRKKYKSKKWFHLSKPK